MRDEPYVEKLTGWPLITFWLAIIVVGWILLAGFAWTVVQIVGVLVRFGGTLAGEW